MRRSVGTLGWITALFALVSCSDGSSGPQGGGGGSRGGTGGSSSGGNPGTGGSSTGGNSGMGGSSSGGNQGTGGSSSGGNSGTGGSSSGGNSGTGGSSSGGNSGTGGSSSGGNSGTGGSGSGGNAGAGGGIARSGGAGGGNAGSGGAGGRNAGSGGQRTDAGTQDAGGDAGDGEWLPLFNGTNLTGWTPSPGHEALFAAGTLAGEPVIHVYPTQPDQSNQAQATLRTNQSYSSYIFHLEYKWGTKRYSDRKQTFRDSGVCFHLCNSLTAVWPDSLEIQIGSSPLGGEWITGDIFMLWDNRTRSDWPNTNGTYNESGTRTRLGGGNGNRGPVAVQLNSDTDWNIVEITVHGSRDAEYRVNGTVVNRLYNFECNTGGSWQPLDRGPIALQAEFAELYFRNPKIRILP